MRRMSITEMTDDNTTRLPSAIETFPKERIDAICSLDATQLYNALYSSLAEAKQAQADLDKGGQNKYKKADCMAYLEGIINSCKAIQDNKYKWTAHYAYAKKTPEFGRKFVEYFGIQRLERKLRGFLTGELYTDLDMKNAHPCILRLLIKQHCPSIITPILDDYCKDRDAFLKDLSLTKTDFLIALNKVGGKRGDPELILKFINELNPVREFFWKKYPDLQATATPGWNVKSSLLNKLMCIEEDRLLEKAIDHLGIQNPVRMFDGFMPPNTELPPDAIDKLNALTLEEGIVWDVKAPETFTFPADVEVVPYEGIHDKCLIDQAVLNPNPYATVKKKYEETRFICLAPICYITENIKSGEVVLDVCDKAKHKNKDENLYYTILDDDKNVIFKPFMDKWLGDPERRTYKYIDFVPDVEKCPENTYNLFTGMAYEKLIKDGVEPAPQEEFQVLLDHLKLLSGDDQQEEVYIYQLKWFAHMLQNPGQMPNVSIVWNSPQGAGKNIFANGFGEFIVGKKSTLNTEMADEFIGKWRNLSNKFFGIYNEASSKDTFGADGRIKALISEPTLSWEAKGKDTIMVSNFLRLLVLTNKDNGIKIESGVERRFMVIQINTIRPNQSYFQAIADAWAKPSVVLGFANYLLNIDLTDFNPQRDRVETELYLAMKSVNTPQQQQWLVSFRETLKDPDMGRKRWKPKELYAEYEEYMEKKKFKPLNKNMFGRNLRQLGGGAEDVKCAIYAHKSGKGYEYYKFNRKLLTELLIKTTAMEEGEETDDDDDEVELEADE